MAAAVVEKARRLESEGKEKRKKKKLKRSSTAMNGIEATQATAACLKAPSAEQKRHCTMMAAEKEESSSQKRPRTQVKDGSAAPRSDSLGILAIDDVPELSAATRQVLSGRGIHSLFEIQQKAFGPAFAGGDVVGRAKTGCGKTLAFVLPIVERIRTQGLVVESGCRRTPICVAVAPTRELARQIFGDFEAVGEVAGLRVKCFYGGTAFGPQCQDLRDGIDIVVCTPGRLLDHVRRLTVDLSHCRALVLDEADEMLSMGFQEDVDSIMEALPRENVQKLLFSATLPKWVNALVSKHLRDPVWIDVTRDDDKNATNSMIVHKCVSCPPHMRGDCIGDLCKVHAGHFGKTLVFTGTKKECDELAANDKLAAIGAGVLHGDIGQNQRDSVMDGFRSGRIRCLVATDVAARGLDVPAVDLVVQTHPPQDLDMYVHRAGRTARAGREGTSVTFYTQREEYIIQLLEHKRGIKMQRVGPPQPADIVRAAVADAVKRLDHVHQDSVDAFSSKARELVAERGAEVALAAALAALTGHERRLRGRSLLSAFEGFTAMLLESDRDIEKDSKGWYLLRQMLPEDIVRSCKGLVMCKGGRSCVFDVPDDMAPRVLQAKLWHSVRISVPVELPELQGRHWDLCSAAQQLSQNKQERWKRIQEKKSAEKSDRSEKWPRCDAQGSELSRGSGRGRSGGLGRGLGIGRGVGSGFSASSRGSGRGRGFA